MEIVIKLDRTTFKGKKKVKAHKRYEIDTSYEPVIGFCIGRDKKPKGHKRWAIVLPFCVIQITNCGLYNTMEI